MPGDGGDEPFRGIGRLVNAQEWWSVESCVTVTRALVTSIAKSLEGPPKHWIASTCHPCGSSAVAV